MKKLLLASLILIGCCSSAYYIQSQNKDLSLDVLQKCDLKYAGNECIEKYEITNSTTIGLEGNAVVHIDYEGNDFDGIGINVSYDNLTLSNWINGSVSFTDFDIPIGTSFSDLLISTNPALCPGEYTYSLVLTGTGDIEYSSGGSGSFYFAPSIKPKVISEGDLIRNPNDEGMLQFDIYIIKYVDDKQFKRLILNPHVFESYEHMHWEDVKLVDSVEMNSYTTSSLVRVRDYDKNVFENEVYKLFPNGDVGIKRHLNMSKSEFEARGYDADSIYEINVVDRDAYTTGEDIK